MKVSNFTIFTIQRSGSTWLQSLLHSPPQVRCYGEMFKPNWKTVSGEIDSYFEFSSKNGFRRFLNKRAKKYLTKKYLTYYFNKYPEHPIGFKLMLNQTDPALIETLENLKPLIIRLRRKNVLRQHISSLISFESGTWHVYKGEKIKKSTLNIETKDIIGILEKIDNDYNTINRITENHNCLDINYEDLTGETFKTQIDNILEFLGINGSINLSSDLCKQNPGSLYDLVENYEELHEVLHNSKYAFCLE